MCPLPEKRRNGAGSSDSGASSPLLSSMSRARAVLIVLVLAAVLQALAACRQPITPDENCESVTPPDRAWKYIQECTDYDDSVSPWHVCITRTRGSRSKDVLFYLHGYSNDRCAWLAAPRPGSVYRAKVAGWWEANGMEAPTVVVFSIGRKFLLTPGGGRYPVSWFVESVLPEIEKKLGPKEGDYVIWGTSMGGHNALQLYLWYPWLWEKAILNSPLIPVCDPYAGDGGASCILDTGTPQIPVLTRESLNLIREFYPSGEAWAEADPLKSGPRLLNPDYPPLLIEIGIADEFGFYTGTDEFRKIAEERGVSVEYIVHGVKGGPFWKVPNHLYFDVGRFAGFIIDE